MSRSLTLLALTTALATATPDRSTSLWHDKPAAIWTEALPVGNGSLGGMIFGGTDQERIQFNEQTLWTDDEIQMGSYQPFGDVFTYLPGLGNATSYRRKLDLSDPIHRAVFTANGMTAILPQSRVSKDGVYMIDLLPALPDAWKDGFITGLRARGGFGIDVSWSNGKLAKAVITSEQGGKTYIRANGKIQTITLPPNGKHEVNP